MITYTSTPDYYKSFIHSGVKGMQWRNHKYLNKVNGFYRYSDGDFKNDRNNLKLEFEKRKKMLEMKYKNSQNQNKKDTPGNISEKQMNQKSLRNDNSKANMTQEKAMQYKYYKKYLSSVGNGKAMSFNEFVNFVNKKRSDIKNVKPKVKDGIDNKFKMMREMANRKLKAKYKK